MRRKLRQFVASRCVTIKGVLAPERWRRRIIPDLEVRDTALDGLTALALSCGARAARRSCAARRLQRLRSIDGGSYLQAT